MTQTIQTLWDDSVVFPSAETIVQPDVLTHVSVAKAVAGEYHYLHECAIAFHEGAFYAAWANGPLKETNETDEVYRGSVSRDGGLSWSGPYVIGAGGDGGQIAHNHGSLFVRDGQLYALVTRWQDRKAKVELFRLAGAADQWQSHGTVIDNFIPFNPPLRLTNGNWIIGGETPWATAAVAISQGDALDRWDVVTLAPSPDKTLLFPEVTVLPMDDHLLAIARSRDGYALAASGSLDGRSWETLAPSNFPMANSKPFALTLSTGQRCLIANIHPHRRTVLAVALTAPGGRQFRRIYTLRHAAAPVTRFLKPGSETQWSYPWAIEHDGKLFVIYTAGKEDASLSIIPLKALES